MPHTITLTEKFDDGPIETPPPRRPIQVGDQDTNQGGTKGPTTLIPTAAPRRPILNAGGPISLIEGGIPTAVGSTPPTISLSAATPFAQTSAISAPIVNEIDPSTGLPFVPTTPGVGAGGNVIPAPTDIPLTPDGGVGPFSGDVVSSIADLLSGVPNTKENAELRALITQAFIEGRGGDALNLSNQAIAKTEADALVALADIESKAAVALAKATGLSLEAVAKIQADVDRDIAFDNNLTLEELASIKSLSDAELAGLDNASRAEIQKLLNSGDLAIAVQTGLDAAIVAQIVADATVEVAKAEAGAQLLAMLGNPSFLGTITGLGGINPFTGGEIPGFSDFPNPLAGFNPEVASFDRIPTLSGLRNVSDEDLRFLEGGFSTRGLTPTALANRVQGVTPLGFPPGASGLVPTRTRSSVV